MLNTTETYSRNLSGFSITVAEIISANNLGETIDESSLSCAYNDLGAFISSIIYSEDYVEPCEIELKTIDELLTKNNTSLKGVIYEIHESTIQFRFFPLIEEY